MTWHRAAFITIGMVVLAYGTRQLPYPWAEYVATFIRYSLLTLVIYEVWVNRYERRQDREALAAHRLEIITILNHRLSDLATLKQVAETLVDKTSSIALRAAHAAEQASRESQERHEKIGQRLDEVLEAQKTIITNGHATKPVIDDTNTVAHEISDSVIEPKKPRS